MNLVYFNTETKSKKSSIAKAQNMLRHLMKKTLTRILENYVFLENWIWKIENSCFIAPKYYGTLISNIGEVDEYALQHSRFDQTKNTQMRPVESNTSQQLIAFPSAGPYHKIGQFHRRPFSFAHSRGKFYKRCKRI